MLQNAKCKMQGVRLKVCAYNRVGLLSDITRVLRENGLAVLRADVATQGDKSVNAFYVRDISGNNVDLDFIKSIKTQVGALDLQVDHPSTNSPSTTTTTTAATAHSIGERLKFQIDRLSLRFVAT